MNNDDWMELVAQVESHGPESVTFYLGNSGPNGEDMQIYVNNVSYTDNMVKVVLE